MIVLIVMGILFGSIMMITGTFAAATPENVLNLLHLNRGSLTWGNTPLYTQYAVDPGLVRGIGAVIAVIGLILLISGIVGASHRRSN